MPTIQVTPGSGVAVELPNANGQQPMTGSRPVVIASNQSPVDVIPANITTKFREAFEALSAEHWATVTGSGDIVQVDGNTAGASYLDISKSPYVAGNETTLETVTTFNMPVEIAFGAHRSQATLGQEFSFEFVDTGTPLPDIADLAITSITQTTTVLTIDFAAPHGLVPGKAIGVRDCSNQLANYPALVVASIPSPTQITATAGPGGTITSQTITNPAGAKGFVFFRERFGRASNGVSQIFENATATSSAFYVRSEAGDSLPSGTIAGAHGVTVGTTASVQLVNTPYAYAFAPTTEYRIMVQADRVQWSDAAVDAVAQTSNRLLRTQIVPDPSETYKFRIRANNSKSLSIISGKVVSVTKTGTTTGTFNAPAHGLVTGDLITYYGNSNAAAAFFPNLTAATAVTVVDANTFTAVIGSGTTGGGYGGIYSKVQGGNILPGVNNNSAVNATLSTLTGGTRQLVLTGAASWSGLLIGDIVEVVGVSNVTDGALLGVDGTWRVANSVTAALTLTPATAAVAAGLPADFALTNSGGAIVKRTCLRVSFVRIFDYERERVEMLARPTGDISGAAPVTVQNVPAVTVSSGTITTVSTVTAVTAVTTAGTPLVPATPYFVNSLATTNGALILTGTSGLQAFYATNTGAVAFVKLYNKATAPTVGTDVPEMIIPVPHSSGGVPGVVEVTPGFNGYRFPLGLGIAITGGVADTDTTAVAAGQVKVKLSRTV
jgi:hypothetical protein